MEYKMKCRDALRTIQLSCNKTVKEKLKEIN